MDLKSYKGQWSADGARYQLSIPDFGKEAQAIVEGDRMTISGEATANEGF